MEDSRFLHDLRSGDMKAFRMLYDSYFSLVMYYSFSITKDQPESEDIAMDTLLKFWKQELDKYDSLDKIRNFLFNVAKHSSIDYVRKQNARAAHLQELAYLSAQDEQEYLTERSRYEVETIAAIYREIDNLAPQTQRAFKMVYIEGLPVKEVAHQLRVSVTTIHRLCSEARQKLRKKFPDKQLLLVLFFFLSKN